MVRPEVWQTRGPTWLPVTTDGRKIAALCCIFRRSTASLLSESQIRWVRLRMPKSIRPPPDAQLSISTPGKRRLQPVDQRVGAARLRRVGHRQHAVVVPLDVFDVVVAQSLPIRSNRKSRTSGRAMFSAIW